MRKILLITICMSIGLTLFAQNEEAEGDIMAAEDNYSGAARMYAECMASNDKCLLKLFALIYDKKISSQYTDQLISLITPLAQKGDEEAEFYLGYMYAHAYGVEKDEVEAVKWYRKSAEQGLAAAQNNLGYMYLNGYGVEKNEVEAFKWFRKSADKSNKYGQNSLGYMYLNGYGGIAKDEVEALKWFRKSAEQGYAEAQYNLGIMFETGSGVPKNEVEAAKWYRKSADQGNQNAIKQMLNLK